MERKSEVRIAVPLRIMLILALVHLAGCATYRLGEHDRTSVAGRTYVVTGATSGLGRGVALELAALGANVVVAARRTDVLEEVARQARAAGSQALAMTTDVSRAEDMDRLAQAAIDRFGRIDVWINNAGIGMIGMFWDIPQQRR